MTNFNLALDSFNIIICIVFFLAVVFRNHLNDEIQGGFKYLLILNFTLSVLNILMMIFEGTANSVNHIILCIVTFLFYAAYFALIIACCYEITLYAGKKKNIKFVYGIMIATSAIYFILLAATPFTNILYKISDDNIYTRGNYFFAPLILEFILYLVFIYYTSINRKEIEPVKRQIITIFILFPQVLQIIEIFFSGLFLLGSGISLAVMTMFILSQRWLETTLDNLEIELNEKEIDLINKVHEAQNTKLEVIKMQDHTIESLSNLVENRDEDTGEHVRRTRAYVELIAIQLMKNNRFPETLNASYIRFLKRAAPMHDIGKIVVPDAVLKKPGRLTPEEFEFMKKHASEGGRIVHEILDGYENPEYIKITADIATHHHEKWDGTGYPDGLKGEEIPLCARIMALADVFDALVSPRVYKTPMSYEEAYHIIESGAGTHFDPLIAQDFLSIKEKTSAVNEIFKEN